MTQSWPAPAASGVGSMPGEDFAEAVRVVLGEVPELPHLPELPARGPAAGMVGRACATLVDLAVDLQPSGWRLTDRPGVDARRARRLLASDLDDLAEIADSADSAYPAAGPMKLQVTGPWTLAASLDTPRGGRVLADPGAVRDVVASLAEGVAAHVADLHRRLPDVRPVLQMDEPLLPAVLAGRLRRPSGLGRIAPVEESEARQGLAAVIGKAGVPTAVHSCAPDVPLRLLADAGASAVAVDISLLAERQDEALAETLEQGVTLWWGAVPVSGPGAGSRARGGGTSEVAGTVETVGALWRRLGLDRERLARQLVVTPACGLAGVSPQQARAALRTCRDAVRELAGNPEAA